MWSRGFAALVVALMIGVPGAAQAAWLKGETDKFVVYTDGGERDLREFIERLGAFDYVLRVTHPSTQGKGSAAKFEVYLLRGTGQLRRFNPSAPETMLGYYSASPGGVYAVAIRRENSLMKPEQVLFHEYTHRFMLENFSGAAYPGWLIEAYAEYYGATVVSEKFADVGGGNPARATSLLMRPWIPMDTVLSSRPLELKAGNEREMFYAQGWLLLHYMKSDGERAKQLDRAIRRIGAGEGPVKAFYAEAQTDGPTLTRALRRYLQGKTTVIRLPNPPDLLKDLKVSTLPPSADDLLPESVRLNHEDDPAEAAPLLERVRSRASRYPDDLFAQLVLARAEVRIGDLKTGLAILDRLLAQNPEQLDVIREAAHAQMARGVRVPTERQAAFRSARPLFGKAYQKDPNDFRTLYGYAQARSIEPDYPNDNALEVLLRARELAPSVEQVSLQVGAALIKRDKQEAALYYLTPLANDPHGGEYAERAKALIAGAKPKTEDLKGDAKADEAKSGA